MFHLSLQLPEALPGREYIIQQDNILSSDIPPCELQVPQYVLILSFSFQLLTVFLYPDGFETVRNAQPFRQIVAHHRKAFPLSFPCRCRYRYQYRIFLRSVESRMFQTQCQYPCDQLATVSSFLKTEYQVAYPFLVCIRLFNLRWVIVRQALEPVLSQNITQLQISINNQLITIIIKSKYYRISLTISIFGCIFGCRISNTPSHEHQTKHHFCIGKPKEERCANRGERPHPYACHICEPTH